jgi:uncharacterized damage-inducible protein DinB
MNAKQQFTSVWTRENATTRRVLHAVPTDKAEFQPSANTRKLRELAFIFSKGQGRIAAAVSGTWKWPPEMPPAPPTWTEVLGAFDATTTAVKDALTKAPDSRFDEMIPFFVAPKQTGDIPVADLIWFMLLDSVHHRGQLSTYLRLMNAKVPSIYGPSADEQW